VRKVVLPSISFSSLPLPHPALKSRPLKYSYSVWGVLLRLSTLLKKIGGRGGGGVNCKLPSGVWDRALPEIEFDAFGLKI